jgi:hypothetical protein
MNLILNKASAELMRDQKQETQKYMREYDFVRRFTALANTKDSLNVPVPSEGDLEVLGYNIEYDLQNNGLESLHLRFGQSDGGKSWSNDLLPIRSIATPGARIPNQAGIRYGYRDFSAYVPKNDSINIEYENTAAENLEIEIIFKCMIWLVY